ncbi:MAG: phosphoribosylamine--glycine ligase [Dehalococcoidia bacterium]
MNVLVVGSGAREHALAWKLRQSPKLTDLFVTPGNAGAATVAENLSVPELDFAGIERAVRERSIDLVVVGPEAPLAAGIVDYLVEHGVRVYGPTRAAAQIESSKVWSKALMQRHSIPTAEARSFDDIEAARRFVLAAGEPPVVKADGLAAGKGVVVAESQTEALEAIEKAMTSGAFGDAGRRVVLEERLRGREVSAHAFCDGRTALPMVFACDHKAVFDGGRGPNTGGMGAYSPPPFVVPALAREIFERVVFATVEAMAAEGLPFVGTLYPGLFITDTDAGPKVIEYNCRFGDPETQVILPRLKSDLLTILLAAAEGRLAEIELTWDERPCVAVVMASGGYPGAFETGILIEGLDDVDDDVHVFHAATRRNGGGVVTAGGRVLTVAGSGETIAAARERVYDNVRRIRFAGAHYRTDIGLVDAG